MKDEPREYESKFLEILQEFPKYCVVNLGHLDPDDIKDELIQSVWRGAVTGIGKNTDDYDSGNIVSGLVIKSGIADKGFYYQSQLQDYTAESVVSKIQEMAYQRRVDILNNQIHNANNSGDVNQVALLIEKLKDERMGTDTGMKSAAEISEGFSEKVTDGNLSLMWGIGGMDHATGGKEKGTLVIVAARPGMGKTSLLLQAARGDSINYKAGIFELEMSATSLWARVACPVVGVDWKDVIANRISADKKKELLAASKKMAGTYNNLYIDDTPGLTVSEIYQKTVQNNLDIIYIDHLGIMGGIDSDRVVKSLGDITMRLKNMSKSLEIPVVLAVQLNRSVEKRANKIPMLSDLRDSGEIEQNADDVLMMYRPSYYDSESDNNDTEIWVRKFRNGEPNVCIDLQFDREKQWFDKEDKYTPNY